MTLAISANRRAPWVHDALVAFSLLLAASAFILASHLRRPDVAISHEFLFSDPGTNLLLAERLSEGARLYRDIGFSYGPLAIHPYRLWSEIFGNSPRSYSSLLGMFSLINVLLAYAVMRTRVSRTTAAIVVVVGLLTTILIPSSIMFGYQSSMYFVLERTFFLIAIAIWTPPTERTVGRAIALGAILGLCQWLRFGTAFFLGLSILLLDVLAIVLLAARRPQVERWLRISVVTLLSFLLVQGAWVIYAFATLPRADALDAVWPSYVLAGFAVWPEYLRRPEFVNVRHFAAQQLTIVVSGLFAIAGTVLVCRRLLAAKRNAVQDTNYARLLGDLRLVLPLAFYTLGCVALFKSVYHFSQYAWTLPITAALLLERNNRLFGAAFALLTIPTFALTVKVNFVTKPPSDAVWLVAPNGAMVVVPAKVDRRVHALREYAGGAGGRPLFIVSTGAGFHAMFDVPQPTRQSWHVLGFARAGDDSTMLTTLATVPSAIVLSEHPPGEIPGADPCAWYNWRHFESGTCRQLATRLAMSQSIRVDSTTWIIPGIADSVRAAAQPGPLITAP